MRPSPQSARSRPASRSDLLAKRALGAWIVALLCASLAFIDLDRFERKGAIWVGRESQILTGGSARLVIGVFALGAVGFFACGVHALWLRRRIGRDS